MEVASLTIFPFKGLSGLALDEAWLRPGVGIPGDRALALKFAEVPAGWQEKSRFLQLTNCPSLARLRLSFDPKADRLRILDGGQCVLEATGPQDAPQVEAFFTRFLQATTGRSRPLRLERQRFPDVPHMDLSLLLRSSIQDLSRRASRMIEEERFRMNVILDDPALPAFAEWDLVGQTCRLGAARVRIGGRLPRCPAPNVNPVSGERDLDIPELLQREYGHQDLGVLAQVVSEGRVAPGDRLVPEVA